MNRSEKAIKYSLHTLERRQRWLLTRFKIVNLQISLDYKDLKQLRDEHLDEEEEG